MQQHAFDIVFIDLNLPGMNGMEILSRLRADYEDLEAIIITGNSTIESAVEAMKIGCVPLHFKAVQAA